MWQRGKNKGMNTCSTYLSFMPRVEEKCFGRVHFGRIMILPKCQDSPGEFLVPGSAVLLVDT